MPAKPKAGSPDASSARFGTEADFDSKNADTFRRDLHPDLRAYYVLANPPFNDCDWFRKDNDVRCQPSGARQIARGNPKGERGGVHQFGVPPKGNANFAWVQHIIHHLSPHGMAGFVFANGSMSFNQSGEGEILQKLIEADLVDCMVAPPASPTSARKAHGEEFPLHATRSFHQRRGDVFNMIGNAA